MPRMDGMETLRLIMRRAPLPVIMVSTHSRKARTRTFKALALGAIDFVAKRRRRLPAIRGHRDSADRKIKVANAQ